MLRCCLLVYSSRHLLSVSCAVTVQSQYDSFVLTYLRIHFFISLLKLNKPPGSEKPEDRGKLFRKEKKIKNKMNKVVFSRFYPCAARGRRATVLLFLPRL